MPAEPIVFYFDYISPYAFIAWRRIGAIAKAHGRQLEPAPVLFGALLDAHGTLGPAEVPAKRIYTFKDAWRKAAKIGATPLVPPPAHPFNPLTALRVTSLPMDEAERTRVIDALFDATWQTGEGIDTDERVAAALGPEGAALVAATKAPEVKERLRARTEEAVSRGVFGVPTAWIEGEIFWGTDGMDLLESYLRGEDTVPKDMAWAERPRGIVRKAVQRP